MVPIDMIFSVCVMWTTQNQHTGVDRCPHWICRPSSGITNSSSDPLVFHWVKPYSTGLDRMTKSHRIIFGSNGSLYYRFAGLVFVTLC